MRIKTIRRMIAASAIGLSAAMFSGAAMAEVPALITHQGRLFDAKDEPVNGTIEVVFTIYDSEEVNAKALWTETHSVTFENGYFSVALGEVTPFDTATVFDGSVRYLGIKVGADPEMTPRAATRSVPYALLAGSVPSRKMGVYMGIFNFFIVIPQLVIASVLGLLLNRFFGGQPIYALAIGGVSFFIAGLCALRVR